jgi:SSS family solute:Na+ symporter
VDFIQPRRPGLDTQALAKLGRWLTLGLMLLAAAWAPMIDSFPGLFAYLQQAFAYVTPPLVAVFALGFVDRRLGARAAFRGALCGHALSAGWFVATQLGWLQVHFTIVAGLLFAATVLMAWGWRAVLDDAPTAVALASVDQARAAPSPRWLRPLAMAMVVLTLTLVFVFR